MSTSICEIANVCLSYLNNLIDVQLSKSNFFRFVKFSFRGYASICLQIETGPVFLQSDCREEKVPRNFGMSLREHEELASKRTTGFFMNTKHIQTDIR